MSEEARQFGVYDFTYDYAGRAATECHRQAGMSDECERALWDHMAIVIKLLQGELRSVHKCWDEDCAELFEIRRQRRAAAVGVETRNERPK